MVLKLFIHALCKIRTINKCSIHYILTTHTAIEAAFQKNQKMEFSCTLPISSKIYSTELFLQSKYQYSKIIRQRHLDKRLSPPFKVATLSGYFKIQFCLCNFFQVYVLAGYILAKRTVIYSCIGNSILKYINILLEFNTVFSSEV